MAGVGDLLAKEPLSNYGAQSVFPLGPLDSNGPLPLPPHHTYQSRKKVRDFERYNEALLQSVFFAELYRHEF